MKKKLKGVYAFLLALCLILSFPTVTAAEETKPAAADWMGGIDGNLTLAQFTIPGTHDSCTQYCILGKCQFFGAQKQLEMGVRFLDIRLKVEKGELKCYHGFVNCFVSFTTVMNAAVSFLKAHPQECIIMSVKNEGDDSDVFENVLVNQWIRSPEYNTLWFTEERVPKLDEVRGKIVLMRRYRSYDTQLACGIDASRGWKDNETFVVEKTGYSLAIQDNYSYDTIGLNFGKWKWQAFSALNKAIPVNDPNNREDLLWLNFASGCNKIGAGQLSCAVTVNGNLLEEFAESKGNHGIVIMDYVDKDLVDTVWMTNFK